MRDPIHFRRRRGAARLEDFLREACERPCPVLLSGTWLWVLSYGGRWGSRLYWD